MGTHSANKDAKRIVMQNFAMSNLLFGTIAVIGIFIYTVIPFLNETLQVFFRGTSTLVLKLVMIAIGVIEVTAIVGILGPMVYILAKYFLNKIGQKEESFWSIVFEGYMNLFELVSSIFGIFARLLGYVLIYCLVAFASRYLVTKLSFFKPFSIFFVYLPYAVLIYCICKSLRFIFTIFVLIDEPEMSMKGILDKTYYLFEGKLWSTLGIIFNYVLWFVIIYAYYKNFGDFLIEAQNRVIDSGMAVDPMTFAAIDLIFGKLIVAIFAYINALNCFAGFTVYYTYVRDGHINNPLDMLYRASEAHHQYTKNISYDGKNV